MAGYRDLYVAKRPLTFAGVEHVEGKPGYIVLGVPFDSTASYRSGQRFAPMAIREASVNLEGNGYMLDGFVDDVNLYDEGDIIVPHGNVHEMLSRVSRVVREVAEDAATPVLIGGEHTVTLGALRGLAEAGVKPCVVSLDAHFDLRSEYMGERYSHASWLRRAVEELGVKAVVVGVRAYDKEELGYAEVSDSVSYIPAWAVRTLGVKATGLRVKSFLAECREAYLTIDMDFFDPAYAPGVGNPEPGGLDVHQGLQLIAEIASTATLKGMDIVEVTPHYDQSGASSLLAAKTLQQALIAHWLAASRRR